MLSTQAGYILRTLYIREFGPHQFSVAGPQFVNRSWEIGVQLPEEMSFMTHGDVKCMMTATEV